MLNIPIDKQSFVLTIPIFLNLYFQFIAELILHFWLNRQNQLILLDTLDQEVTKFREFNALLDLNSLVCGAPICTHYSGNQQCF